MASDFVLFSGQGGAAARLPALGGAEAAGAGVEGGQGESWGEGVLVSADCSPGRPLP